jgi:hypothetical protein
MDGLTNGLARHPAKWSFSWVINRLRDPRQPGKVTYPLVDILLLRLLAVTARAEGFTAEPSTPLTAILPAKHAEQLSQQANRAYQLRKWLGR